MFFVTLRFTVVWLRIPKIVDSRSVHGEFLMDIKLQKKICMFSVDGADDREILASPRASPKN
ncbi:MAG: hypothetical protein HYV68_00565 [Candidatus Taylorbacteria bacterium]|nr:hypothetical protein [Candidatus Taylorbacteria bacterium]